MNYKICDAILKSALPPHVKLTALAFAKFSDENGGSVFPSVALVARLTGRTRRTVHRHLVALKAAGFFVGVGHRRSGVVEYGLRMPRPGETGVTPASQAGHPRHTLQPRTVGEVGRPRRSAATPASEGKDVHVVGDVTSTSPDLELSSPDKIQRTKIPPPAAALSAPKANGADAQPMPTDVAIGIAKQALQRTLVERRDDPETVRRHYRAECLRQGFAVDEAQADAAIGEAFAHRERAQALVLSQRKRVSKAV